MSKIINITLFAFASILILASCRKIFKGEIVYQEFSPEIELVTLDSIVDNHPLMPQGVTGYPSSGAASVLIDMDEDGIDDFKIEFSHENYSWGQGSQMMNYGTGVRIFREITGLRPKCSVATDTVTTYTAYGYPSDINYANPDLEGEKICKSKEWNNSVLISNSLDKVYVGVKFDRGGKEYFGWVLVENESLGMRIVSKAYNSKTYKIKGGQIN